MKLSRGRKATLTRSSREKDAGGRRHSLILRVLKLPALERWSLVAADCVHNLRCALDHLVYAIAVYESGQDPPPNHRGLQFPIAERQGLARILIFVHSRGSNSSRASHFQLSNVTMPTSDHRNKSAYWHANGSFFFENNELQLA
jgi:hypothetical protein